MKRKDIGVYLNLIKISAFIILFSSYLFAINDFSLPRTIIKRNDCRYEFIGSIDSLDGSLDKLWQFSINGCKDNSCFYNIEKEVPLYVYCSSSKAYCKINQPILNDFYFDELFLCEESKKKTPMGNLGFYIYGKFIKQGNEHNIFVGCDFIIDEPLNKGHSGRLSLKKEGFCPVKYINNKAAASYARLNVRGKSKLKITEIVGEKLRFKTQPCSTVTGHKYMLPSYEVLLADEEPLFIEPCTESECDFILYQKAYRLNRQIARYSEYSIRSPWLDSLVIPECDFVSVVASPNKEVSGRLILKKSGICKLNIFTDKKRTIYLKSIKGIDGYKALITKKKK